MKCQSILAISLDLQNYLLRARQCRYKILITLKKSTFITLELLLNLQTRNVFWMQQKNKT